MQNRRKKRFLLKAALAASPVVLSIVPFFSGNMTTEEYARVKVKMENAINSDPRMDRYGFALTIIPKTRMAEPIAGLIFENKEAIDQNPEEFLRQLNADFRAAGLKIRAGTPKAIEFSLRGKTIEHRIVQLKGKKRINAWGALKQRYGRLEREFEIELPKEPPLAKNSKPAWQRPHRVQHRA